MNCRHHFRLVLVAAVLSVMMMVDSISGMPLNFDENHPSYTDDMVEPELVRRALISVLRAKPTSKLINQKAYRVGKREGMKRMPDPWIAWNLGSGTGQWEG